MEEKLIERPSWMLWGAIIALTFASFSQAHASEAGRDGADVIEEIVVVGNKKKRRLNPDRISNTRPSIEKPSRFELRLLPVYDPEEASRHFRLAQHYERLRGVGTVTLFRLSFGR